MASLIDAAKAIPPSSRTTFFDRLTPAQKATLLELKLAFHAGELPSWAGPARVYREVVVPNLGELCAEDTFIRWFKKHEISKAIGGGNPQSSAVSGGGAKGKVPRSNR
jgi:hypothetical protein